ncbi:hypothetical protein ADK76_14940 [Streptomyces griseoflavus]|nr:hypothetical protein ADK76_14940 [Streptomyces griseoflavus]
MYGAPPRAVCAAGPTAVCEVLGNLHGSFAETSGFFHTHTKIFGLRPAQIAIDRAARDRIRGHLDARRAGPSA